MCGIAGHVVKTGKQPDRGAVRTATTRLAHRGPDAGDFASFDTACLGHRRLSIIDVAGSPQPWSTSDKRYTIVFNGEIYNYLELRRELQTAGVQFRSEGDTEVLLAAYIHYGERCLTRLNGMFAFAIWDNVAQTLFMARDRVGKKPLFYALVDGGIAFASELTALLAFQNINRNIDTEAVRDFFTYQYIPAPRTIYQAIRKLPAAHFLRYEEGRLDIERYWAPPQPVSTRQPLPALAEELRSLTEDAVRLRLRSDVPLGAFLSGGLDSSIIVGVMSQQGVKVDSFHVGFDEASYDESEHAQFAANHFGTNHHSVTLPLNNVDVLDAALSHFGEPFADPSFIPTWHLCQHTRKKVTVALSGDGADELFAGYRRYQARRFVDAYLSLPNRLRSSISTRLLRWVPETSEYYGVSIARKLRLFIQYAENVALAPNELLAQTFSGTERGSLLTQRTEIAYRDRVAEYGLGQLDSISQMILADILVYLPDDILVKVDRMSMAHALEVRNPFLDHRIVEFACRLPLPYKLGWHTQKRLLRIAFNNLVPSTLLNRPKHGFAVPLGAWFRTTLKEPFHDTVLERTATDYVNRDAVVKLWQAHQTGRVDHGFKLWSLLVFHRWLQTRTV